MFNSSGPCTACQSASDAWGDHALGCAYGGERIACHNQLRDALFDMARQASLGPAREERALIPGREDRPADVFIPGWSGGRDAALDITVVSPMHNLLRKQAAEEVGSALEHRLRTKMDKYHEPCNTEGIHFTPQVLDTFGAWHREAVDTIKKLGRQLAAHTGREEGETVPHMFQRLSILLAKENSALILSRTLSFVPSEVDGDLDYDCTKKKYIYIFLTNTLKVI